MGRARKPDSREVDELWKSVKSLGWSRRQFLALLSSGGIAAVLNACKSHSPSVPARNKADEACISSGAEKQEEPASSQSATSEKKTSGSEGEHLEVYDYIIVGSGAGGGPLAANLARAGQKVLLLEAGGNDEPLDYSMPVRHGYATENEALSWRYYVKHYSDGHPRQGLEPKTVPTTDGRRRVFYPRAGTLGGCTAHYAMIIVYPHNSDWDYIAEVTGDESWRPDKMRKYFECVERYRYVDPQAREESDELLLSWRTWLKRRLADFDSYIFEADARVFWNILADSVHWAESIVGRMAESAWWKNAQHGFAGWLPVNQAPLSLLLRDKQLINIVRSCVDTALTYGLEPITWRFDPNHWIVAVERREGLLRTPMATDGKKRRGVREYLVETQKHYAECLTIETHALATKILFQDCDPLAADGVEYRRGAHLYAADPKSAVKETEERDGLIFVRHPASRLEEKCEPQEVLCKAKAKKEVILAAGAFNTPQLLMLSGIGPEEELRKHNICVRKSLPGVGGNLQDRYEVGVITELENNFTVLEDATFSDSEADLAFLDWKRGEGLYTTNGAVLGIIKRSKPERLDPDLFIFGAPGHFNGYYPHWSQDAYAYKNRFSWVILKAHTNNNAGTVRLTSCRPEDTPDINFRYFDEGNDDGEDLTSVLEGIKFVRQINKRVENRVLIRREIIPGDSVRDDQQLREFIKNNAWGHHACGTCKMGPPDDPLAVVDGQFRVYGVKNLRIVDASIFPKIPGFFIVSAIYMISEKASAVLLGDARPAASCGNRLEAPGRVACER